MASIASTLVDRFVGYFDPNAGLRRLRAREMLVRAYEGASQKDGWRPRRGGASANTDHLADGASLRTRARALVQNVPYISRGLESLVANTIGTGIAPRSLSTNATAVDKLWNEWAKVCDADGRLDLYGLQANAYRAMEQDGEVLIRLRARRPEDGLPVPLQLQVLEIDWLDSAKMGSNGGNTIMNGIEYDALGKIVYYWLWDQHPGELTSAKRFKAASYPVPADRVIHLYAPQRPGQGRGFTRLAPVIARVRDVQLYEDAELQRKNLETRLSVLASGDISNMSMSESEAQSTVRATGELGTLASGGITQVPTGVNLTVVEPKAAGGYVEYVKYQLHLIAAGMGVTYEMLTGDVREVNFSSARVSMLEFRRNAEQMQWLTLIPRLCEPIWRAFVDAASMAGKMRPSDYGVDWSTPKWDYVNPEQDVKADLAEVSGGLSTISEKLRRRGYKPELVFAELKSDFDRLRADGTLDIMLQIQTGQAPQAPKAAASQDAARSDPVSPVSISFDVGQNMDQAINRAADAMAQRMSDVPININVPAPVVNITNDVRATDPVIHVTNEVHPATVEVTAKLPARQTSTEIQRNDRGQIVRSIATETNT
jgi:lambda family phage portal protein